MSEIVFALVFVECECIMILQFVHTISFALTLTVFSHNEQIAILRFIVGFLLFCLLGVGVDLELVVDFRPGFVSISPFSNVH